MRRPGTQPDIREIKLGVPNRELEPGSILDNRFELVSLLGKGGSALVFKALHLSLKEHKAVKILPCSGAHNETATARFQREAITTVKLKHPNIVDVTDAGVSREGHRFMVMELLLGENLEQWIQKTPLEKRDRIYIRDLLTFLVQACDGLQAAHDREVIHRDIKSRNIFLHKEKGRIIPKILDFGIARSTASDEPRLTLEGLIAGTTDYISPEQAQGDEPDKRSDIYQVGVVLYEALTGNPPLGRESKPVVLSRAADPGFIITPPHQVNPYVSKQLSAVVLKALKRNPNERYQRAADLRTSLSDILESRGNAASRKIEGDDDFPETKRLPMFYIALASAALIVTGLIGYRLGNRTTVPPSPVILPPPQTDIKQPAATQQKDPGSASKKAPVPDPPASPEPPVQQSAIAASTEQESALSKNTQQNDMLRSTAVSPKDTVKENPAEKERATRAASFVNQGNVSLAVMRFEEAETFFKDAVSVNAKLPEAWFGLARVAFEKKDLFSALEKINTALGLKNSARHRIFKGDILEALGDVDAAIREWRRAVNEFPKNKTAVSTAEGKIDKIEKTQRSAEGSGP